MLHITPALRIPDSTVPCLQHFLTSQDEIRVVTRTQDVPSRQGAKKRCLIVCPGSLVVQCHATRSERNLNVATTTPNYGIDGSGQLFFSLPDINLSFVAMPFEKVQ